MKPPLVFGVVLALALMVSAVSVVYVKHRSRTLFVELQALERNRDRLDTEWSQLALEHSAWATHDRIEALAANRLRFHDPEPRSVEVVGRR